MKKVLLIICLLFFTITLYSQEVTKFLGIPIDGYKTEMIQKLQKKGFVYDSKNDCLSGEFNGRDVNIFIGTNNNKVYRIMLVDQYWSNESDIKIRFNTLCSQFEKNGKYLKPIIAGDYKLTDDDDISYQLDVENKRIQAAYYQIGSKDDLEKVISDMDYDVPEQITDTIGVFSDYFIKLYEKLSNRTVWFMIESKYGKYRILMYYDNELNHSDGEDL